METFLAPEGNRGRSISNSAAVHNRFFGMGRLEDSREIKNDILSLLALPEPEEVQHDSNTYSPIDNQPGSIEEETSPKVPRRLWFEHLHANVLT
jgi:hypothetical protein